MEHERYKKKAGLGRRGQQSYLNEEKDRFCFCWTHGQLWKRKRKPFFRLLLLQRMELIRTYRINIPLPC